MSVLIHYGMNRGEGSDAVLDFHVFDHPIDSAKRAQMRGASSDEIATSLCVWLDTWTNVSFIDWEYIMYAGVEAGDVGKVGIDDVVLGWLKKDDSLERIEIVADFLEGYWMSRYVGQASKSCVKELTCVLKRISKDTMPYGSVLLALHASMQRLEDLEKMEVRDILLEHLKDMESRGVYPHIISVLATLKEK